MTVSHLLILLVCLYLNIVIVIALLKIFSAFITLKTINKYSNLSIVGIKKLKNINLLHHYQFQKYERFRYPSPFLDCKWWQRTAHPSKEAPDETIWFDETKKITDTIENTQPVMNLSGHRFCLQNHCSSLQRATVAVENAVKS